MRERDGAGDAVASGVEQNELLVVLDEELKELPERYRTPLVLCHLEGKTQHEAAEQLGLSYGTLRRHLDRGRKLLKTRIGRRGVMASTALLAALLKSASAQAAVPAAFVAGVASSLAPASVGPVTILRPRVSQPSRVPRPTPSLSGSASATVYSMLLAGLLAVMAIPPVVTLLASAVDLHPSAGRDAAPSPYFGPGGTLNRAV